MVPPNHLMLCLQSMGQTGCSRQHQAQVALPHASEQYLWQRVLQHPPPEVSGQMSLSAVWQGYETGWGRGPPISIASVGQDWAGHGLYMAHEC